MESGDHQSAKSIVPEAHPSVSACRFFLCVAPVMCFVMVWLTPPFQVADEFDRFFRIFQISEGQWYGIKYDNRVVGFIPVSLVRITGAFRNMPFRPQEKLNRFWWRLAWSVPLCPEQRMGQDFCFEGFMPPFPYLPQAVGMRIGTLLNCSPMTLFYLSRLTNATVWCLIVYLALRLTPTAPWMLAALALSPISVYQAASLSCDATLNSLSFLILALILRRAVAPPKDLSWKELGIWMLLIVIVIASKPFYAGMALLLFLVPPPPLGKRAHIVKTILCFAVVTLIFFGLWRVAFSSYITYDEYNPAYRDTQLFLPGVDVSLQTRNLVSHPGNFIQAGWRALFAPDDPYETWIGELGWLDTPLPIWFHAGFGLLILILMATNQASGVRIAWWQRTLLVGISVSVIVLLLATLYIHWTPIGALNVRGVNGRYFIPILPLVLVAFHGRWFRLPPAWYRVVIPICLLITQIVTITTVLRRYYF